MPIAKIHGANINYEVLGSHGPWIALSPGGRRALDSVRDLAQHMADRGHRVLIHDRRNCGVSDLLVGGEKPEYEIWAQDLHELLKQLGGLPVFIGGSSSGCRLSLLFALKYPQDVRGLMLWRVTGGPFAANRLTENYYGQYIRAAQDGGMKAVCELGHFKERIEARPDHRDTLMAQDPKQFVAAMQDWMKQFARGAEMPIIGASEADLRSIKVPTLIIPGNDKTHSHASGELAHRFIANSELHDLFPGDLDIDLVPQEDWGHKEEEMASIFADFIKRAQAKAA